MSKQNNPEQRRCAVPTGSVLPPKLSDKQWIVLSELTHEWGPAPRAIKSTTLLSMQNRKLIQCRMNPKYGAAYAMNNPYTSFAWQWRLSPNQNE